MLRNRLMMVLGLLLVASMVLAACQPTEPVTEEPVVEEPTTEEPVVEEPAGPTTTRHGGWLDMIVVIEEPSDSAAIRRLEAGEIDIYAYTVAKADLLAQVVASENLAMIRSYGSYNELTLNPVGPTFEATGKLNPFSNAKIREAVNWLVDRDYIAQEITQGMAIPRYFCFAPTFADYAKYADLAAQWEAYYAFDEAKAKAVFDAEMVAMGATFEDGKWMFNGEQVEIIGLIRLEDERLLIGGYFATQLENLGFLVTRQEKKSAELAPIWQGNPNDGLWHFYTGGWITTAVPRTEEDNFIDFYSGEGWPGNPLWDAYVNSAEFDEAGLALYNRQYATLEERRELFATLIPLSLQEAQRVWTTNRASFTPFRKEVTVVGDLAGAVAGSRLWPYTIRRIGEEGGALTLAMPSILTNPWNPLGGSNWIYDQALTRATSDVGVIPDPWTGLARPQRIESAEVYAQQDLPIGVTYDWVTLTKVESNVVPADAWIDWNAETQTFVTVGEKFPEGLTSLIKSVAYYPADLWNVTWHDGSPIDIADFVFGLILTFDRGNELSAFYDPAAGTTLGVFQTTFKGFKIASADPLVIEYYTDNWQPDAENNVTTYFPNYGFGPGAWHSLSIGLLAEAAGETAFTQAKSKTLEKDWMSYISGPTVAILKTYFDTAQAENYIPYAATLGQFITADEATARWANYAEWYRARGHFWIGTGPYYLERAFPVEGMVVLKNFSAFVDLADKWAGYGLPPIPVIDITAPADVKIGSAAEFEILVSFNDEPYAIADVLNVSFLVFGADGALVFTGVAEAVEDGVWKASLTAEQTATLTAGSTKLTAVVVSALESIPSFESVEFVTSAP
ncbi:MAG: ABC transporter substrate-binding protein [Chloroflexi bacterium]|nr:ABC transporter substrate-binding protein [Chloroflexota bacterium]